MAAIVATWNGPVGDRLPRPDDGTIRVGSLDRAHQLSEEERKFMRMALDLGYDTDRLVKESRREAVEQSDTGEPLE